MCKNRAECESELEESRNGYWVIDAQMATSERDSAGNTWEGSVGIPAFYLHENVQGILTEDHAKKIALQILNPLNNPYFEFSISATKL